MEPEGSASTIVHLCDQWQKGSLFYHVGSFTELATWVAAGPLQMSDARDRDRPVWNPWYVSQANLRSNIQSTVTFSLLHGSNTAHSVSEMQSGKNSRQKGSWGGVREGNLRWSGKTHITWYLRAKVNFSKCPLISSPGLCAKIVA